MSVYVDPAQWEWRGFKWCHLLADSLEELHMFAQQIGTPRFVFQCPPKTRFPHYDLPEWKREQALQQGAIAVDRREIVIRARLLRAEFLLLFPDSQ